MILFITFKKLRGGVPAAVRLLVSPHGYDSSQRKFSSQTSELRAHVHGQFCHHVNHGRQFAGGNSIHRAPEKSRFIGYNLPKRSYYFTGNHGFNHQIWGFPLNQPNDICST